MQMSLTAFAESEMSSIQQEEEVAPKKEPAPRKSKPKKFGRKDKQRQLTPGNEPKTKLLRSNGMRKESSQEEVRPPANQNSKSSELITNDS